MKPTATTYAELQLAYDTFNKHLFDNSLPECLITLQREKRTYGYFSAQRFANSSGEKIDEIAMNPSYFAIVPLLEIMQTLVHEMAHLWQHHYGTPGRGRYHNQEWATKMECIGLMPSSTGQPGGKRLGDHIGDYPIEGGKFLTVCKELLTCNFRISWYDRFPPLAPYAGSATTGSQKLPSEASSIPAMSMQGITIPPDPQNKSNRSKYTCACNINVWGKPSLSISCGACGLQFIEQP